MKKNILENGTRVISYAPDTECDNELGTITSSYEYNNKVYYDIHLDNHEEGCEDLDMNEEGIHFDVIPTEFINLTPHDIKWKEQIILTTDSRVKTWLNMLLRVKGVLHYQVYMGYCTS